MAVAELKMRFVPSDEPSERVTLDLAGTKITIPAADVLRLVLEKMQTVDGAVPCTVGTIIAEPPPRIGNAWPSAGGIYAGVVRGGDGQPDYHLIVADIATDSRNWKAAIEWATAVWSDGYRDYTLPRRKEQAVLFGNVPELFAKEAYWSSEEYAGDASYAWCQYFGNGSQTSDRKAVELRARAVRRVPIE